MWGLNNQLSHPGAPKMYFWKCFNRLHFFKSSFRFTPKQRGRYRFPITPLPPNAEPSILSIIHGTFVTIDDLTLTHHHPKSIVYIRVHFWCCTFSSFGQIYNDIHPPLISIISYRVVSQPKNPLFHLFIPSSPTTDFFVFNCLFPFPTCHVVGIIHYVDFSDWLLLLGSSMHLSFLHAFSWLHSSFLFSAEWHSIAWMYQFIYPFTYWRPPWLFPNFGNYKQSCL